MKPLCIYHGKCADGFTAAWAVWKAIGDCDFHPGVYGQQPPNVAGRDVIMVDFSYKRAMLGSLMEAARSILILDHHKTAREDLAGLGYVPARYEDFAETSDPAARLGVVFDMDRSGAQIAWDFFHPGKTRPVLVDYVGDRDLWQFKLPMSREVNAYVFAWDYTFENWDFLDSALRTHADVGRLAEYGSAIERKHHKDVAELVEVTRIGMTIAALGFLSTFLPR